MSIASGVGDWQRIAIPAILSRAAITRATVFIRPLNFYQGHCLLSNLGCELDQAGFLMVNATGQTTVKAVWAAGNPVDPRAQVITAAGAGTAAAIAINADLVQDDNQGTLIDFNATEGNRSMPANQLQQNFSST